MTRSGILAAAALAMTGNGQVRLSLQSCNALPSIRHPVSPKTTIRLTWDGTVGSATSPTVSLAAVAGTYAVQSVIGKAPSATPRWRASAAVPSATTCGQEATPE